jgi:hypothetical protein
LEIPRVRLYKIEGQANSHKSSKRDYIWSHPTGDYRRGQELTERGPKIFIKQGVRSSLVFKCLKGFLSCRGNVVVITHMQTIIIINSVVRGHQLLCFTNWTVLFLHQPLLYTFGMIKMMTVQLSALIFSLVVHLAYGAS